MYLVRGIPSHLVDRMWPFAEPYIKRALDHAAGEFSPDDLRESCRDRDAQLWLVSTGNRVVGAMTTEIVEYPKRKHCRVITIAGSGFDEWIATVDDTLVDWSRAQGCDALEAYVRRGFVKRLDPLGYRHKYSVVTKKLPIINEVAREQQNEQEK